MRIRMSKIKKALDNLDRIFDIAQKYYGNNHKLLRLIADSINIITPVKRTHYEDGSGYSEECMIPGRPIFIALVPASPDEISVTDKQIRTLDKSKLHEISLCDGESFGEYFKNVPDLLNLIYQSVEGDVIKQVYLFGPYAYEGLNEHEGINLLAIIDDKYNAMAEYLKMFIYKTERNTTPWLLEVKNESMFHKGLAINKDSNEKLIIKKGKLLYG